ncbi:MAG: ATP-dependent DNA helicase, partial [Lachnoclostridium sp.]|nr:ATP-dependent DNA helicase [Lachnoclostridium sp.]
IFLFEDLETWFMDLIEQYAKWAMYEYQWKKRRNKSIKGLDFPFPYREGQRDLVVGVYQTLSREKKLYLEAPTGVGKTISTVFPALKAMGEGLTDRIFYLTAKTITRTVAEECFDLLSDHSLIIKPITLTSKEKLCVLDKMSCNPYDCPRAKGHYSRINDGLYDLILHENRIDRDLIQTYAKKHMLCPYEMSLDAALFADAVICDYNYVFDPVVYLKRFFSGERRSNYILLVDEAHNLVERGREMYSAVLYKEDFLAIRRIIKKIQENTYDIPKKNELHQFIKALESGNRQMLEWKRECDEFREISSIGGFSFCIMRIIGEFELFFKNTPTFAERDTVLEFYFNLLHFSNISESMDEKYVIYTDYSESGDFRIKLQCMDPSTNLKHVLAKVKSAVFFSATLLPIKYYREQLAGSEDDYAIYAPSSFPDENRKILIARDVSSKYSRRNEKEYQKIVNYLYTFSAAKKGNYLFFFPSYSFMEQVYSLFENLVTNVVLLVQNRNMSEQEKEDFLNSFSEHAEQTHIGFCVMGGIFSEGIDLKNDRLIGAAIIGTGLPMVCQERELFRRYYEQKKGQGFDYAYLYPGINKVLQSGGRVIRTAQDKGVVLLLDERFALRSYYDLFPREWYPNESVRNETLEQVLKKFW